MPETKGGETTTRSVEVTVVSGPDCAPRVQIRLIFAEGDDFAVFTPTKAEQLAVAILRAVKRCEARRLQLDGGGPCLP